VLKDSENNNKKTPKQKWPKYSENNKNNNNRNQKWPKYSLLELYQVNIFLLQVNLAHSPQLL